MTDNSWPFDRRLAFNKLVEAGVSRNEAAAISWEIADAARDIREGKS